MTSRLFCDILSFKELVMTEYFKLTEQNETMILFSIPHLRFRRIKEHLMICLQNGDEIAIAKPGKGGNFNLSFNWALTIPAKGYGLKKIKNAISKCQNLEEYSKNELMLEQVSLGINKARKRLLKNVA